MPRSIQEIQADMARVQAAIDERNTLGSAMPEYRAARFDYVVDGDRSGLDAMLGRVAAAAESRRARESAEKIAMHAREEADDESRDQIVKELQANQSIYNDMLGNPNVSKFDKQKQLALVNYWRRRAAKKNVSPEIVGVQDPNAGQAGALAAELGFTDDDALQKYTDFKNKYRTFDNPDLTPEQHLALAQEIEASDYYKNPKVSDDLRGIMFSHRDAANRKLSDRFKSGLDQQKTVVERKNATDDELAGVVDWINSNGKDRSGNWFQGAPELMAKAQNELDRREGNRKTVQKIKAEVAKISTAKLQKAISDAQMNGGSSTSGAPVTFPFGNGTKTVYATESDGYLWVRSGANGTGTLYDKRKL